MLKKHKVPFEEIRVRTDAMWDELEKRSGMTTVPQVYVGDRCLGGFQELQAIEKSGRWQDTFNPKGAVLA